MEATKSPQEAGQESANKANCSANSELIATVQKNSIDQIRVSWSEYKGHRFLDVRTYTSFDDGTDPKPTKKGITLKPDLIPELIEALEMARDGAG